MSRYIYLKNAKLNILPSLSRLSRLIMKLSALLVLGCIIFPNVAAQNRFFAPRNLNQIPSPGIVNGVNAEPGEIPYQVSLQVRSSSFHFCGGSILNENYVITAAHCVSSNPAENIKVIAGTVNLQEPGSTHNVARVIIHENYNENDSWRNDIALLQVETPFEQDANVDFVPLPEPNGPVSTNSEAVVSGWGRLSENGPTIPELQRANIFIADQNSCRDTYNRINYNVYDTQVCAHDPDVERGSCQGDSGGPLTVDGVLVGLVSWAAGCGEPDYPGVYTRVPSYIDWIEENAV